MTAVSQAASDVMATVQLLQRRSYPLETNQSLPSASQLNLPNPATHTSNVCIRQHFVAATFVVHLTYSVAEYFNKSFIKGPIGHYSISEKRADWSNLVCLHIQTAIPNTY